MKKIFVILSMLLTCVVYMTANEIVVPNIVIPKGGTATLNVQLNNEQVLSPVFEFYLRLPDGIAVVDGSEKLGDRFSGTQVSVSCQQKENRYWVMAMIPPVSSADVPIPGNEGTIVTIEIQSDETIQQGAVTQGFIEEPGFITWYKDKNGEPVSIASPIEFQITIGEPADTRIVLDELSTSAPHSANGVDVRVKRTLNANEWSTICLPFNMTALQVKEIFGDDVQLGDFAGSDSEFDDDDNVTGISVKFEKTDAILANHPYIIKVSAPIAEFSIDHVDIQADEDEAYVEFDNGRTGSRRVVYSGFYGTYHAETVLDENVLYLEGNQFHYSSGQTTMKAYRAYFDFLDKISDTEGAVGSRIVISFNDDPTTRIDASLHEKGQTMQFGVYDLQGRKVNNSKAKGLYIENGKKKVKK
ncbi:MAG: hypothetical protein IJ546_07915 [Prevotella sp.]|nr:hypothetical protein [Prevotella sp.]